MNDRLPEFTGDSAHERHLVARLGFVPDSVLFEKLRKFYRSPDAINRIGRSGLVLYSVKALEVTQSPRTTMWESDSDSIAMSEVDRVDRTLRRLSSNDMHMALNDHLGFKTLPNNGIALEMSVQLGRTTVSKLIDTPFVNKASWSVDVRLGLARGEHASGAEMHSAAVALDATLKSDTYPRPGVDSFGLRLMS